MEQQGDSSTHCTHLGAERTMRRAGYGLQGGAGPRARGAERHGSAGSFLEGPLALGPAGEGRHEVDGAWKASGGA